MENAVNSLKAKGAIPIISSQTPDNIWSGSVLSPASRFVGYAQLGASQTGVTYVDHFNYVATQYESIGQSTVNTYYPIDHTHTSVTGATVVAQAFVRGLVCGKSALASKVNSAGHAVPLSGEHYAWFGFTYVCLKRCNRQMLVASPGMTRVLRMPK